jgi:hypothetical protein
MRRKQDRTFFMCITGLVLSVWLTSLSVQAQQQEVAGFPIDWSYKHVAYHPGSTLAEVRKMEGDPRYLRNQYLRENVLSRDAYNPLEASTGRSTTKKGKLSIDWAVSLAKGSVAQNMSPAKYSFNTSGAASCSDWVVFGLNVAGNTASGAGQANLIAVNNLYGSANGCATNPQVIFAYATSGPITTSPVISYSDNGQQVAFIDNESGKATLHVVKYATGSSNGTAAGAPVTYPGTGTEVHYSYSSTTNTNSPMFVDYFNDAAYVGDDGGTLYKISPIFGAISKSVSPSLVWSAALPNTPGTLTGPVLDQMNNVVLVGASNGYLYARKASDGTAISGTNSLQVGSAAIVDPPVIVMEGTGLLTYVFATSSCNSGSTNGVLYVASEQSTGLANVSAENIGKSHNSCATNNLHAPALDDNVYSGTAGYVYVCGTQTVTTGQGGQPVNPELYSFSFPENGGVLGSGSTLTPSGTSSGDECSPLTYFTSNSTSKIFLGVGSSATDGWINSSTVTSGGSIGSLTTQTTPSATGGTSGIIVDNSSSTSSLANLYFSGLAAGNVGAGASSGSCKSFTVNGSNVSTTVTLTGTGLNFSVGNTIVVSGFTGTIPATYNGTWTVATVSGTTSLTYVIGSSSGNSSQSGKTASWGTCGFQLTQSGLS